MARYMTQRERKQRLDTAGICLLAFFGFVVTVSLTASIVFTAADLTVNIEQKESCQ